jgi:hypothetical protein
MANRRPLGAGLDSTAEIDPGVEKQFVYGPNAESKDQAKPAPASAEPREKGGTSPFGRMPLTTRVRSDYGTALKRASLERQLKGIVPNTVQDILEDALGPWLRANGYIP